MNKLSYRQGQLGLLIISLAVLFSSLYFQYVKDMEPCPLCLMQRFCVILAVILSGLAVFSNTMQKQKWFFIAQIVVALAGLYFAGRQLWLQSLTADQLPACLPGLDVLMRYFPWSDVFHALMWGAADCAEVHWQWLGITMAGWSALYFVGLLMVILIYNFLPREAS